MQDIVSVADEAPRECSVVTMLLEWAAVLFQKEEDNSTKSPVAAMAVTKLPSMLRPILPPGCGFAVIDNDVDIDHDGQVIFHSQPERNGAENFIEECEDAPELKGAVRSNASRHFTARYWGEEHMMFVRPLKRLPWHIVVFQEKSLLQTVRFEAIEVALVLLLFEAILVIFALLGIWWLGGQKTLRSLWPAPDDTAGYARTVAISVLMILGLATSIFFLHSPRLLVIAGLMFPIITVTCVWFAATVAKEARHRWVALAAVSVLALMFLIAEGWEAYIRDAMIWPVWLAHAGLFAASGMVAWKTDWTKPDSPLPYYFLTLPATTRFTATGFILLLATTTREHLSQRSTVGGRSTNSITSIDTPSRRGQ